VGVFYVQIRDLDTVALLGLIDATQIVGGFSALLGAIAHKIAAHLPTPTSLTPEYALFGVVLAYGFNGYLYGQGAVQWRER